MRQSFFVLALLGAVSAAEPEKVHTLDPKIAKEHTTFYDKRNQVWRTEPQVMGQVYPIYPGKIDPWVYEFSLESMPAVANSHVQQRKGDIAEAKMEENTHFFSNDHVDALPYVRPETAYDVNGSGPQAHHSLSQSQDIIN